MSRLHRLLARTTAVTLVALGFPVLHAPAPAQAATVLSVSTTSDTSAGSDPCGNPGVTTAPSPLSLRDAACVASNMGGQVTIAVPAGTYDLTRGELVLGTDKALDVTLAGAGAGATTITAGGRSRVLALDPSMRGGISVTIDAVTLTGGADSQYGGAAIIAGSNYATPLDRLTITNSTITGNVANAAAPAQTNNYGGAIQMVGGILTITDSTVSDNASGSSAGGAVAYITRPGVADQGATFQGVTFTGNSVTSTQSQTTGGGALYVEAPDANVVRVRTSTFTDNAATSSSGRVVGGAVWTAGGLLTVDQSTFLGNEASGGADPRGGALGVTSGRISMAYSRIAGNAAASGEGLAQLAPGTALARHNWWGCNGGPAATACDSTAGGAVGDPWVRISGFASPSTLTGPDATSRLILHATDSMSNELEDETALEGVAVAWSDPQPAPATLSATTSTFRAGDTEVAYRSATASGAGSGVATIDAERITIALTVRTAPAVTVQPQDRSARPGDPVSLTAAASGYPAPTVQWQRSAPGGGAWTDIGGATTTTLAFPAAPEDNAARYRAVFTNAVGTATSGTATLTVGVPPTITSPATADLAAGSPASFTITTTGTPAVSQITRTGTLPAGVTFTDNGDGTATLAGTPATGSGGAYPLTITAANGVTPAAEQTLTLRVAEQPVVTEDPADRTVDPGQPVTFTAAASGYPVPTVQWQRSTDGGGSWSDIANATSATYSLTAVRADDGNRYRAVFTNGRGSDTTAVARLSVGTAPSITSPATTTFRAGVAGSFQVTTTGVPAATLTATALPAWLSLSDHGDGTATLSGTPPSGSGGVHALTLRAGNGFTPSATQSFDLVVHESPRISTAGTATFTVGTSGTFTVRAGGGYPAATTLTTSGTLPTGLAFTDNGDGTASISGRPAAGTGGTYALTLTADNGVGTGGTQAFTVRVEEQPAWDSADRATFTAGEEGSFTVRTTAGFPTARTLTKTGALPAGVTFTDNGDGTATIAGTPAAGTGATYPVTLTASNGVGLGILQAFVLTVREAPAISSADRATFTVGQAGSFTVRTTAGYPSARTLTRSGALPAGVTFTDNGDGTATIAGTPAAGTGGRHLLDLTASNGVGAGATQAFTLVVEEQPSWNSADRATFTAGEPGSFTVRTAGGFPLARTITRSGALPAGVTFTDNGDGTATIAGTPAAGTGATYPVTLTATNGVGLGILQAFVLIVREAPTVTSADRAELTVGTAGSFTVRTTAGYPSARSLTVAGALPTGLSFTDNGDGTATLGGTPAAGTAGDYPLTIRVVNGAGSDDQAFVLTVSRVAQTISFSSVAPGSVLPGASAYTVVAAATSGLAVALSIDPASTRGACSLTGSTVRFTGAGSCIVAADQAGDGTYLPAPTARQTIVVRPASAPPASSTLALTVPASPSVYGQQVRAEAAVTVAAGGGSAAGTVRFAVDGAPVGDPVPVSGGVAVSPPLTDGTGRPLEPGSHQVSATFEPATATVAPASASAALLVQRAATAVVVEADAAGLRAEVRPVAPGAGSPTGTVEFLVGGQSVGSAPLIEGVATLPGKLPAGEAAVVAAVYPGDARFTGSSGSVSTTREDPTLTAELSSADGPSSSGWFRSAVTVTFTCTAGGAPLTTDCPDPVVVRAEGVRSITRTIVAEDGGVATVVVPVWLDRTPPKVRIAGVRDGRSYAAPGPRPRCVATDALSGVASCEVTVEKDGRKRHYRAVAVDQAGNERVVRGTYRVRRG